MKVFVMMLKYLRTIILSMIILVKMIKKKYVKVCIDNYATELKNLNLNQNIFPLLKVSIYQNSLLKSVRRF